MRLPGILRETPRLSTFSRVLKLRLAVAYHPSVSGAHFSQLGAKPAAAGTHELIFVLSKSY